MGKILKLGAMEIYGKRWGNIFSSRMYVGHWNFLKLNIKIINQSIEAIKKRIPDCKINVI
jgi:hypothetical protein